MWNNLKMRAWVTHLIYALCLALSTVQGCAQSVSMEEKMPVLSSKVKEQKECSWPLLPIASVRLGIHTIVLQSESLKWKWSLASAPRASHCLKSVDILELNYDRTICFLNHKQVVCPKCCKMMKWVPILNWLLCLQFPHLPIVRNCPIWLKCFGLFTSMMGCQ